MCKVKIRLTQPNLVGAGVSLAINHSVPLKIVLFKTIFGPIKMKVWFGGVGDEFRFQNVQVPNTHIKNLG